MSVVTAVEWGQGVSDAWSKVASFVPELIGFALILVAGYFVAKMLSKATDKALERVGFDKAVERGGIRKALASSQLDASDIVSKIVYYGLMLFVLELAFSMFGNTNPVSQLLTSVVAYLPKAIAAVIIVVVTAAIATAVREMAVASLGGLSYGKTIANVAGIAIAAFGVFAALNQLQIATPIVNGLFYAVMAALVGVTIVAVGGGGIRPMQKYWEASLSKLENESGNMKQQAAGAGDRIRDRAEMRMNQARHAADGQTNEHDDMEVDVRHRAPEPDQWTSNVSGRNPGSNGEGGSGSAPRNPQGF